MNTNPYSSSLDTSDPHKHPTYYLKGNAVVHQHEQATSVHLDYAWLSQGPDHNITGQHMNGKRWMWSRDKFIQVYTEIYVNKMYEGEGSAMLRLFKHLDQIPEDHPISKLIAMHKLVGAL